MWRPQWLRAMAAGVVVMVACWLALSHSPQVAAEPGPQIIPMNDPNVVVTVHVERRFGHGVGMSQYGARGRALAGQSAAQILSAYYPGTYLGWGYGGLVRVQLSPVLQPYPLPAQSVPAAPTVAPVPTVIACPAQTSSSTPAARGTATPKGSATAVLIVLPGTAAGESSVPLCKPAVIPNEGAQVRQSSTPIVGTLRLANGVATGASLYARFGPATIVGAGLEVPQDGRVVLWRSPGGSLASVLDAGGTERVRVPVGASLAVSARRGVLEVAGHRYRGEISIGPNGDLVNTLNVEDYLTGVVGPEMGSGSPFEALKAQAIASRTYALWYGGTLFDTTTSQVYAGVNGESSDTSSAVRATSGQVVKWGQLLARTLFHSCSQYHTLPNQVIWPGAAVTYLQGIADVNADGQPYAAPCPGGAASLFQVRAGTLRDAVDWTGLGTPVSIALFWDGGHITGATLVGSDGSRALDVDGASSAFGGLGLDESALRTTQISAERNGSPDDRLDFADTGLSIQGNFKQHWLAGGGLVVYGPPISEELQEDGSVVQYFELAEFQWMPDVASSSDGVTLALLGSRLFGGPSPQATPVPDARYFPETGHNVAKPFLGVFEAQGGIDRFGYPLTEQALKPDGGLVQYFQRGWLEIAAGSTTVTIGAVGKQAYAEKLASEATPTPSATPTLSPTDTPTAAATSTRTPASPTSTVVPTQVAVLATPTVTASVTPTAVPAATAPPAEQNALLRFLTALGKTLGLLK